MKIHFSISIFILLSICSCNIDTSKNIHNQKSNTISFHEIINDTLIQLTEVRKGDILVKPNHNWLPGTAWVFGGSDFGHALIVIEGSKGNNALEVLSKSEVFESHSRNVPPNLEVRRNKGYNPTSDPRYLNLTFSPSREGYRYRLRPQITEQQVDSLISFIAAQVNGLSNWRALKNFGTGNELINPGYQTYFYCSHLIWQAFYSVLGIDLDVNGGIYVYPNDLIASPFFDNDTNNPEKRVRF